MHSDFQTTSVSGSLDDFCRSMLQLVAELSPCSEERLFITAVNRELVGSRDLSLGDVKALLHKCVQQLEAQGLLKIHGEELVITEPGNGPLEAQGSTERAPEPTREEIPASIRQTIKDHEAGQATGQMEAPQAQADEEGEDGADNQIITESGNGTLEAQGSTENAPEPRMEEIVAHIRQIIKNHEAGQATGQAEAPQAQADEEREGEETIDDIARPLNGGDAATAADEEDIFDLTAELGGLEIVEHGDQPMVKVTEIDETLDLDKPEDLEPGVAVSKAAQVPTSTTPQAEPFQFETAPQQPTVGVRLESSFEDQRESVSTLGPMGEPEPALNEAAEMMRDIVMVLLLLALAAISVMSWFGGKPSVTTILIMIALLLVGSAVWGWRGRRR